ncbi:hypothetical protein GOODEAATRI_023976 [Goodea atripinnis]|uniref:Uncharacterized protein n=1 Tax=Goodea atripinnis TaxID=208336 RepID=A0ABV0NE31_9TELE
MRGGKVIGNRAKTTLHLNHLIIKAVGEGDEGLYILENSKDPNDLKNISLIVRGIAMKPLQGRISVSERSITVSAVTGADEGSYTIRDGEGLFTITDLQGFTVSTVQLGLKRKKGMELNGPRCHIEGFCCH